MRKNDFLPIVKKNALNRSNNRCERFYSIRDLEFHHKIPVSLGGKSSPDNCVVLCHNCHNIVPKNEILLEKLFLRFASTKEMIQNYNAVNEEEAIKYLSKEIGMDHKEIKKLIKKDPISHIDSVKHRIRKRVEIIGHSGFNIPYG